MMPKPELLERLDRIIALLERTAEGLEALAEDRSFADEFNPKNAWVPPTRRVRPNPKLS